MSDKLKASETRHDAASKSETKALCDSTIRFRCIQPFSIFRVRLQAVCSPWPTMYTL